MSDVEEKKVVEEVPEETPAKDEPMEAVEEKPVEEEKPVIKETEEDDEKDNSARYSEPIRMSTLDGTLNVMVCDNNGRDIVTAVQNDQLLAACRANVGITSGRYLVELEVLQILHHPEIQFGLSLENSSVFLGQKQSLSFTAIGTYISDGEQVKGFKGVQFRKNDVVGILLNRTDKGHENTVSLFVNGKRIGEPQKIPESFDGALYPHVSVRNSMVSVNTSKVVRTPLSFKCRSFGDANKEDVAASNIQEVKETTIIVPFGMKTKEMVDNFIAENPEERYVGITRDQIQKWMELSHGGRFVRDDDMLASFANMMRLRKRNYIFSNDHLLMAKERTDICSQFTSTSIKKVALVSTEVINSFPTHLKFYNDVAIPTKEEGFTQIKYLESEKSAKDALAKWQKQCKLGTKIDDLKVGEWFKTKLGEYQKLRDATKAAVAKAKRDAGRKAAEEARNAKLKAEGKEIPAKKEEKKEEKKEGEEKEAEVSGVDTEKFSPEDWMLCDLRVECHLLINAFREDVEDKERISFLVDHLPHYYRLYSGKPFSPHMFGCQKIGEVFDIIEETITIEDKLMVAKKSKGADIDEIIQDTEDARQTREDRIGAGDEGANLKFKARMPQENRNQNKGGKGHNNKGNNKGAPRNNDDNKRPLDTPQKNFGGKKGGGKAPRPVGNNATKLAANYQMRPIPSGGNAGGNNKRPAENTFGQPAKRFR